MTASHVPAVSRIELSQEKRPRPDEADRAIEHDVGREPSSVRIEEEEVSSIADDR